MERDKDLKLEELKCKYKSLIDEYHNSLNPYDFDNDTWNEINLSISLTKEKIDAINNEDESKFKQYFDEYYNELKDNVNSMFTLKSEELTSKETFLRNLHQISDKVIYGIETTWDKIKFLFAIPGVAFASFVFAFIFTLIFGTIINWCFPAAYSDTYDGIAEAISASVFFIIIRYEIFKDVYMNQVKINIKTYLIKHFLAISIWWFIFYFIKYKEVDNIASFSHIEWMVYLPYLTLSAFTKEYFISCIIFYIFLNIIPFVMILIYIFFMEIYFKSRKVSKNRNIKKKKEDKNDTKIITDYDYHFDINANIENLKYKKVKKSRKNKNKDKKKDKTKDKNKIKKKDKNKKN